MSSAALLYRQKYYALPYASRVVIDGSPLLANLVKRHLPSQGEVLDVGAGAGLSSDHPCRQSGITLTGIDQSAEIEKNKHLDRHCVQNAETMPFGDESFDLVFSDFTFEHLERPERVVAEVRRVLKPGAVLIFRTVNVFHYVALSSVLLPNRFRPQVLRLVGRVWEDSFPTFYRLNTKRQIVRVMKRYGLKIESLDFVEGPPDYLAFSRPLYLLGVLYERIANRSEWLALLRANIIVSARKT